jgi:hypothetical protein
MTNAIAAKNFQPSNPAMQVLDVIKKHNFAMMIPVIKILKMVA